MNSELEKLKKDFKIEINKKNIDIENISKIFCKIDAEIASVYFNNKNENIDYENYKNILERSDKSIILTLIYEDLIKDIDIEKLSIIDILITANEIYDYCCLTVHNIDKSEIVNFIVRKGWYYYNLFNKESKKNLTNINNYIEIVKRLEIKYIEILNDDKKH